MEDRNIPYRGQDSGFIWVEENEIIVCDLNYTLIDFETAYKLTEDEVKSLEYAEGVVKDDIFYIASALIEGDYYNADSSGTDDQGIQYRVR